MVHLINGYKLNDERIDERIHLLALIKELLVFEKVELLE
jgi:hypothetical protein